MDVELLTMGRVGVDLYPEEAGVPLGRVRSFARSLGGSATNVAVAGARLGRRSAVVTKVGDDGFGVYVREALAGFGVDARFVGTDPRLRTPVVFCALDPPEDPPILFYRQPKAPDANLRLGELDLGAVREARVLWVTGTGLAEQPARRATLGALEARAGSTSGWSILDLDWRPSLWPRPGGARRWYRAALRLARVAVGNLDEVEAAVGTREPRAAAARLLALGPELVVVKQGAGGVMVATDAGMVEVPAVRVPVRCALGAGDAFGGALCHGLLAGWELPRAARFASAAGAIVASRLACADAMPTAAEVEALLAGGRP